MHSELTGEILACCNTQAPVRSVVIPSRGRLRESVARRTGRRALRGLTVSTEEKSYAAPSGLDLQGSPLSVWGSDPLFQNRKVRPTQVMINSAAPASDQPGLPLSVPDLRIGFSMKWYEAAETTSARATTSRFLAIDDRSTAV